MLRVGGLEVAYTLMRAYKVILEIWVWISFMVFIFEMLYIIDARIDRIKDSKRAVYGSN